MHRVLAKLKASLLIATAIAACIPLCACVSDSVEGLQQAESSAPEATIVNREELAAYLSTARSLADEVQGLLDAAFAAYDNGDAESVHAAFDSISAIERKVAASDPLSYPERAWDVQVALERYAMEASSAVASLGGASNESEYGTVAKFYAGKAEEYRIDADGSLEGFEKLASGLATKYGLPG